MINILIVGAGNGGKALIELLKKQRDIMITGVVDRDENAPGLDLAKKLDIPTGRDILGFLKGRPDVIVNVTGSKEVEEDLHRIIVPGTEIIGGSSVNLMFDLVKEAKNAQEQLLFQASILAQVRNAVIVAGLNGEVRFWNKYAEEMFKWDAAETAGKPFLPLILPENRRSEADELLTAALFEGYWEGEIVARKKDGSLFSVYMNNSVLRNDLAQSIALISISSDITELKRAEEAFRTETSFRKAIEDAVLPGIAAYDTDGRQLYVNRGFCRTVGWSQADLVGTRPPFPYWPQEESDYNALVFNSVLNGEVGTEKIELVLCRRSGEKFHAMVVTTPFHDEYGKVKGWVSSISDITEYKRKEEKLNNLSELLRSLSSHLERDREVERKDTASRVHDEIGQPLAALKLELASLAHRIENGQEGLLERTTVMSDIIDKSIQAVKSLCNELRPWVLDDMGLAEAIKWQTHEFASRTGIEYEMTVDSSEYPLDHDLSTTLFRIFQEMLSNVERHAKATKINVNFVRNQDRLILQMRDNGIGISEAQIADDRSFGLIGIRERILAWGGDIEITGEDRKGTTITVNVPLPA